MRAVGIPGWFVWIFLVLFLWQVLGLFPVIHRLREANSALRFKARLDLLEVVGSLLLFGGSLLSFMVGNPGSGSASQASCSWPLSTP
ncbi:hypothetical protein SAV31267_003290 [Streptomyces avermitilis]|uniref:Uncharacterized protein n=1 Tax=Streptomyces avermitilis TaxID=33903 RepID=A0A4D4MGM7_STRAX|nr:hypothetical protein SAV31267_003290 [Streptomyces avermitilis]